ncbi:MAG: UvrD-helicase domain-containing protein [Ignavibacteria bacterium]|jgi:uncharacterized protein (TIGR00375 family)
MKFIADLHIHSFYSRATSKDLTFEYLWKWAQLKGVHVVGTGDIAHPGWLQEMKDKLEPAEEGLFKLKSEYENKIKDEVPKACRGTVRFLIGGEISNIYKKNDKVRKIHNVVFTPSIDAAEKLQAELEKIGNIRSDGRPILGLDARNLLEIVLETDPKAYLIPAHIWTPWFSLLGSKSGFDSVEECFEDLTDHIFALETGLSSDPPMNWRLSQLDKYTLVSNSDAHSPQKLAREANVFNTDLSYNSLFDALKTGNREKFWGTIEFFPEEGKYHYDGHRKCGIRWDPKTTLAHDCICTVCGKPVTVGVSHRVETLADRDKVNKENRHNFKSLIPLPEILSEVYQVGAGAKKVKENYDLLLNKLGSELSILQNIPLEDIKNTGGELLAEGIKRMREGNVSLAGGFDGEYGVIKLFDDCEREKFSGQIGMFGGVQKSKTKSIIKITSKKKAVKEPVDDNKFINNKITYDKKEESTDNSVLSGLNEQQKEAVLCIDTPLIIAAGPGTGKTRTLTHRIAYLINEKKVNPGNILAITFTNKAAEEMQNRLTNLLGKDTASTITIKTFHALCSMILREEAENVGLDPAFTICNEDDRKALLKQCKVNLSEKELNQYLEKISSTKNQLLSSDTEKLKDETSFVDVYKSYEVTLQKNHILDFDDLIFYTVKLFETNSEILQKYQNRFKWISVDEYQDINFAQYRLLKLLIVHKNNICVIGDPNQAIYGFRGAKREYFLKFQEDFPGTQTKSLTQNYRSTQFILNASSQVIAKGADRKNIEIWSDVVGKTKLQIYKAPTYKAEAEYVVHQIESMVGGTSYFSLDSGRVEDEEQKEKSFTDFAVLYRLGALSHPLIEAFQRSGIPYQTIGDTSLYERREIKEILSCLWFIYNPKSSFYREKIKNKIIPLLEELRWIYETIPVAELIERIQKFINTNSSNNDKQNELIHKLLLKAKPFENRLQDFLESTALQKETDEYDNRADRVTLMTLHASKGLEFPVVFIVGCEETLIPYKRENKPFDIEEERRLFYVGMTRAEEKLILTHAGSRFLFGKTYQNKPSHFLSDIETALKELKESEYKIKKKEKKEEDTGQLGLF